MARKKTKNQAEQDAAIEALDARIKVVEDSMGALATKDSIQTLHASLASKEDVQEILKVFSNIKVAAAIVSGSGKWGFRIILALAAIVTATAVITGGFKSIVISVAAWALPK